MHCHSCIFGGRGGTQTVVLESLGSVLGCLIMCNTNETTISIVGTTLIDDSRFGCVRPDGRQY